MGIFHCYTLDIQNMIYDTVESPVRNQPKCEDLVVAYGRWSFRRNEPQRGFFSKKTSYSGRLAWIIYCMQFLSCIMWQFHVVSKSSSYTPSKHSTYSGHIDQTIRQVVAYKSLKTKRKLLNRLAREVIVVASKRRSFITKCSNCKALNKNALVFWIRFMGSGR